MSSGFISEADVAKAREKRQEEWDKVRTAADPIERPEEPYDPRCLYDKLQEQKAKKDLEYEEAHKLKNMIKGLDDDEVDFLDLVDRSKLEADRKKTIEEENELNDFRNRVASLQEDSLDKKLQAEVATGKVRKAPSQNAKSQGKLLQGVVVRKSTEDRKRKASGSDAANETEEKNPKIENIDVAKPFDPSLKCVGILPGIGTYTDSSEEENSSSDCEQEVHTGVMGRLDLLGRKIVVKETKE